MGFIFQIGLGLCDLKYVQTAAILINGLEQQETCWASNFISLVQMQVPNFLKVDNSSFLNDLCGGHGGGQVVCT